MITRYFLREITRACCTGCGKYNFKHIGKDWNTPCPGHDNCSTLVHARADALRNTREVNSQVY